MSLFPLLHGIAATVLAALVMSIWIAIGTLAPLRIDADHEAALPLALITGSAATSFVLALCALAGFATVGVVACGVAGIAILLARLGLVRQIIGTSARGARAAIRSRLTLGIVGVVALTAWISAISPPRSADAMRYHLAHVRLIVMEGRWNPIQDFHFALPFGWTLSFLPFELLGIPQGSQLLSLGVLVVIGVTIVRALAGRGARESVMTVVLVLLLHPFVVKMFSEAGADPFSLLVVLAVVVLFSRNDALTSREAFALGVASWVGVQSRYQLVAVGIAATAVLLVFISRNASRRQTLTGFVGGGVAGLVLASPFLVANARWFGNPVWPLLISPREASSSYANLVAWFYGKSLTGKHTLSAMLSSAWDLLTWPPLFPLAVLIVAGVVLTAVKQSSMRRAGWFGMVFLALWLLMQPSLYPKFVLMVLPVAALGIGVLIGSRAAGDRLVLRLAQVVLVASATVSIAVSRDAMAYAVTGDERSFHRTTWFYDVYEWANAELPREARVLAIVRSGMTYYLERPYRRGDPWIGGEIDWLRVKDGAALEDVLRRGGYTHVIHDAQNWTSFAGGPEMQAAFADGERKGTIRPLKRFDVRLYASRASGAYRTSRVTVYEVARAAESTGARSAAIASAITR